MNKNNNINNKNTSKNIVNEQDKITFKEVSTGDSCECVDFEYEEINNCGVEKGGDYLVFAKEGAVIPDYVKTIGSNALSLSKIKKITFPYSVEEIENRGCSDAYYLETVTLNEGLKKIGEQAFHGTKIKSIEIPSTVEFIAGGTFQDINVSVNPKNAKYEVRGNCLIDRQSNKVINGMKDSIIPNDIKVIGRAAFCNSKIESIRIPNSVEIIEDYAFVCIKLKNVWLGEGLKKIGERAFSATKIKSIVIPSTVEEIGTEAFGIIRFNVAGGNRKFEVVNNCLIEKGTKKIVMAGKGARIAKNVKEIGDHAFDSHKIRRLKIPRSVENIGKQAFADCTNVMKLVLNEGVKKICEGAFSGLKVKYIVVPSSVETIGEGAFAWCDNLKKIYCRAESKPSGWDEKWNSRDFGDEVYDVVWGYKGK